MALSVRERIVDKTMRLFSRRGYAAVGLNEIVEKSKAPKGSLYHYFPGGKEELAAAAMEHGAGIFLDTLAETLASEGGTAKAIRHFAGRLAGWMEGSRFRDGSPLTAVTVEMAGEAEAVRRACADGYAAWEAAFAVALEGEGLGAERARDLATWIVASMDGATVLARAKADATPIRVVMTQVAEAVETALNPPRSRAR